MDRRIWPCTAFCICALAAQGLASDIGYRVFRSGHMLASGDVHVNDPPFTPSNPGPTDIDIPAGDPNDGNNITNATDVHIFTDDATALAVVGRITLTGHESSVSAQRVRVLIARRSLSGPQTTDLESNFVSSTVPVSAGLGDLGGFRCSAPDGSDLPLSDHTTVSITVVGDVTGDIKSGMLFRVHAERSSDNASGGTISGNLEATQGNGDALGGDSHVYPAIGFVQAEWEISGDIIADGRRDANGDSLFEVNNYDTWGSMPHIVVFNPSSTPPGISGNIHCEYGDIGEIVSNGQIGVSETTRSTIAAGVRIGRISTRDFGSSGDGAVLALPVYADVSTTAQDTPSFLGGEESSLALLETSGDYHGTIGLIDFYGANDHTGYQRERARKGIFVGGAFIGDINVKYSYQYGDMVARSFQGAIRIGQMLKGSIIAVGHETNTGLDGTIGTVEVGLTNPSGAPRPNQPGFNGINAAIADPPFEGAYVDDPDTGLYFQINHDLGTVDSVIRAAVSIGSIHLAAMSDRLPELQDKKTRPRIEAPAIGSLEIDSFDTGSVWSGKLGEITDPYENDLTDDYARVDNLTIGCMGPKADLWVRDCPLVDVSGDVFGEIHIPYLAADEIIRIAGRFGDVHQAEYNFDTALCGPENPANPSDPPELWHNRFNPIDPNEDRTPRGFWDYPDSHSVYDHDSDGYTTNEKFESEWAKILIREPKALRGQIILDATNNTNPIRPRPSNYLPYVHNTFDFSPARLEAHWLGDVEIGTGAAATDYNTPGNPTILSTDSGRAAHPSANAWAHNDWRLADGSSAPQPEYHINMGLLGGGAVGMVPFDLDHTSSIPESDCIFYTGCSPTPQGAISVPVVLRGTFTSKGIRPVFFGPIRLCQTCQTGQVISMFHCDEYGYADTSIDYGADGTIAVSVQPNSAAPFSRVLQVVLLDGNLPAGRYMFRRFQDRLLCDQVQGITRWTTSRSTSSSRRATPTKPSTATWTSTAMVMSAPTRTLRLSSPA